MMILFAAEKFGWTLFFEKVLHFAGACGTLNVAKERCDENYLVHAKTEPPGR